MEYLSSENKVDNLIDSAVAQTSLIFGATEEQLKVFRRYFEDFVLSEIILNGNCSVVEFGSNENIVTDNLKAALIASGISKDGVLPDGRCYDNKSILSDSGIYSYANERVKSLETQLLKAPYSYRTMLACDYIKENRNSLPNAYELVELGIARMEREVGYIKCPHFDAFYNGVQIGIMSIRGNSFEKNGLSDTLAYDICKTVNISPEGYRHYALATNTALKQMAGIDFFVATNGLENYDNEEELMSTLRNIEAAKVTDRTLVEPFEKRFKETMEPYMNKVGIVLPSKEEDAKALKKIK